MITPASTGQHVQSLVIPAAGLGTRMTGVNATLPKEMLPVGPSPAIRYAIDEGIAAGTDRIVVIINRRKDTLRDYLSSLGIPLTLLYQEQPRGESDAIAYAEEFVGDAPVAIIYPDNLYLPAPAALKPLVAAYMKNGEDVIALGGVTKENEYATGNSGRVDLERIEGDVYRICRFHHKGPGHFTPRFPEELRACGMMVCGPHLFDAIRRTRDTVVEGEFTDEPVRNLMLRERGLLGLRLPGRVFDIGNPAGYRACLERLKRGRRTPP